jgi:hypothetical protein
MHSSIGHCVLAANKTALAANIAATAGVNALQHQKLRTTSRKQFE